jgi:hypothetical protein
MTRDLLARGLAVTAIVLALCFGLFQEACDCPPSGRARRDWLGMAGRWAIWRLFKSEFEQPPPAVVRDEIVPSQDVGALRFENAPPARIAGPTGEVDLEHGRGW